MVYVNLPQLQPVLVGQSYNFLEIVACPIGLLARIVYVVSSAKNEAQSSLYFEAPMWRHSGTKVENGRAPCAESRELY